MTPSQTVLQYFAYKHLPEPLRAVSACVGVLALQMEEALLDGPEKTTGLRKLLEAKDCFVRAMLEGPEKPWWQTTDLTEMVEKNEDGHLDYAGFPHEEGPATPTVDVTPPTEDLVEQTVERKATLEYEQAKAINVVLGQCYGPVAVEGDGLERAAKCHWGTCTWTKERVGDRSVSQLQVDHNDAGAPLTES